MVKFIFNLCFDTITESFIKGLQPKGYIKSPGKATAELKKFLVNKRTKDIDYLADNGCFSIIRDIAKKLKEDANSLIKDISKEEKEANKPLNYADFSPALQKRIRAFSKSLINECLTSLPDDRKLLSEQLALNPSHIIGCEDISVSVILELGLKFQHLNISRKAYEKINISISNRMKALQKYIPEELKESYYPVVSAYSYDTAFDAGKVFAKSNIKCLSIGFGAFTSDSSYVKSFMLNKKEICLESSMPNSILRSALVIRGLIDGYYKTSKVYPKAVHLLGLGVTNIMALAALICNSVPEVSFDATSPIYDGNSGIFYVTKPAYLKLNSYKIATNLAQNNAVWDCPCDFCKTFIEKMPFLYEEGCKLWSQAGKQDIKIEDVKTDGLFYGCYPLLSEPLAYDLRNEIIAARVGHNHWMIMEIMREINESSTSYECLKAYVEQVIKNYAQNSRNENYISGYNFALKIASVKNIMEII